jgi:peptide/nickel transport system substrate-binding protein
MNNLTRRNFIGAAGVSAAAVGLAACGVSSSNSSSPNSSSSTGTEGGGTISAGTAYSTQNYDPSSTSSALACGVNWQVCEGLYGIDFHDYSTFNELATGDPQQIDDTHFEVTLRDGAQFSDGNPITPEDVVESFNRASGKAADWEGNIYTSMLSPFESIEKKGDKTVTITTTIPNFSLVKERLAIIRVVPASSTKQEMTSKPIGSGPWMYDTISDNSLELVPNPNYNGDHPAEDNKIHYDVLKDATARLTAEQEGSTIVMEMVTADAVDTLQGLNATIDKVQGFGTRFLMFDVAKAPWNDKRARQAVMYSLDYDAMINNAFAGLACAPTSYLPENFPNYHRASTVYTHDEDKAKQLIQEAGITPGDIELRTTDNEQVVAMATQVKENLDTLGFNTTIRTDTSAATYAAIDQGDNSYDLLLAPGDPSCFGADPDLLMNWWFGDNLWMKTRCPWEGSDEWKQLNQLMQQALGQSGSEQQNTWNQCFDILADNVVLYPVLQVQTVTASWQDPTQAPNGVGIKNFSGIGTTGLYFLDSTTVSA